MSQRIETALTVEGLTTGFDNLNNMQFSFLYFKLKDINGKYIGAIGMESTAQTVEGLTDWINPD